MVGIQCILSKNWASLVAQLVRNMPAMQETPSWFLGWEDSLENGIATHSIILAWRIPGHKRVGHNWGSQRRTWLSNFHFHFSHEFDEWSHLSYSSKQECAPHRTFSCFLFQNFLRSQPLPKFPFFWLGLSWDPSGRSWLWEDSSRPSPSL